jgi:hypothetical protein
MWAIYGNVPGNLLFPLEHSDTTVLEDKWMSIGFEIASAMRG